MSTKAKPIPDGYHSITPYLIVKEAAEALEFYKNAFGAKERMRMPGPGEKIMHAEIEIGGSIIMLADEFPEMNALSPVTLKGTPVSLHLYVEDVDRVFAQAVAAGAKIERPIADQFYGDRSGSLTDPFGHKWHIATHVEDVSEQELKRRMQERAKAGSQC
jgi:PhnB protein